MEGPRPASAKEQLIVLLSTLVIANIILVGVMLWLFSLGGVFGIFGWVMVLLLVVADWRGLRLLLRPLRGHNINRICGTP